MDQPDHDASFDDYDELHSPRAETIEMDEIIESAINRRGFLTVISFGLGSFVMGTSALTKMAQAADNRFGFDGIATSTADTITLPEGFEWETLVSWGDPLFPGSVSFDHETRGNAASQARAFGDNNDGMSVFQRDGRIVMAVNNEYTNRSIIWGNREDGKAENDDDILKGMMAHGVSVFEIRQEGDGWKVDTNSSFNRLLA